MAVEDRGRRAGRRARGTRAHRPSDRSAAPDADPEVRRRRRASRSTHARTAGRAPGSAGAARAGDCRGLAHRRDPSRAPEPRGRVAVGVRGHRKLALGGRPGGNARPRSMPRPDTSARRDALRLLLVDGWRPRRQSERHGFCHSGGSPVGAVDGGRPVPARRDHALGGVVHVRLHAGAARPRRRCNRAVQGGVASAARPPTRDAQLGGAGWAARTRHHPRRGGASGTAQALLRIAQGRGVAAHRGRAVAGHPQTHALLRGASRRHRCPPARRAPHRGLRRVDLLSLSRQSPRALLHVVRGGAVRMAARATRQPAAVVPDRLARRRGREGSGRHVCGDCRIRQRGDLRLRRLDGVRAQRCACRRLVAEGSARAASDPDRASLRDAGRSRSGRNHHRQAVVYWLVPQLRPHAR